MPTSSPILLCVLALGLTFGVTSVAIGRRFLWRRRLRKLARDVGYGLERGDEVDAGLARAAIPWLPHAGAADVRVLDVVRAGRRVIFRVDYVLGGTGRRRNVTRIVAGDYLDDTLTAASVAETSLSRVKQYEELLALRTPMD